MIVSFDWLKDYVPIDIPAAELEQRLTMAGLNHEGTERIGDDLAIDLEVTSNRPDCLGHLGVAREAAVLLEQELRLPDAAPPESTAFRQPERVAKSSAAARAQFCQNAMLEISQPTADGYSTRETALCVGYRDVRPPGKVP